MLAREKNDHLTVYQLSEIDDNIKIENLLKRCMFSEATTIALRANFPREIYAEICKEHADQLYEKKKRPEEALEQYIETIGHLNPSYVIQRYIEM